MFKFIHAADLHLDSPLKGLERYEGAPLEMLRTATRRALQNLVQLALNEAVQFVVIAGDVYDDNWTDFQTGLFFVGQMHRLREAGVPVYLIAGNHDAANKMSKSLRLPESVELLPHKQPATRVLESCGAAIHGQGFATQAVTDNLAAGYPPAIGGCFNLGLLHTCATGYEGHESYAPCSLHDLQAKGYDYWALGHIHQRPAPLNDADPLVVFSGNLQGRNIRESGAKGCLVVTVDDRQRPTARFEPLDVLRWEHCRFNAVGLKNAEEVLDSLAEPLRAKLQQSGDRPIAVRVEITGPCDAHKQLAGQAEKWQSEIRALGQSVGGGQIWIEKVKLGTRLPANYDLPDDGPIAELLALLRELRKGGEDDLASLAGELSELDRKLPHELKEGPDGLNLTDPARIQGLLEQVQPLLLDRLLAHGGSG